MRFQVDTSGLTGLADVTDAQLKRAIVRGLNRAAFDARNDEIPAVVDFNVDRPSPSLKVRAGIRIKKATTSDLTTTITIGGGQGRILARHEFGYTAESVSIPISRAGTRASDKYGNLRRKIRLGQQDGQTAADTRSKSRRKAKGKKRVEKYFVVGRRGGPGGLRPGIYERVRGNKGIIKLAVSERRKKYKASFKIREQASSEIEPYAIAYIQDSIDFRRNK